MDNSTLEKYEQLRKEYARKKRKLKKCQRSASVKAHVQKKLQEQLITLSLESELKGHQPEINSGVCPPIQRTSADSSRGNMCQDKTDGIQSDKFRETDTGGSTPGHVTGEACQDSHGSGEVCQDSHVTGEAYQDRHGTEKECPDSQDIFMSQMSTLGRHVWEGDKTSHCTLNNKIRQYSSASKFSKYKTKNSVNKKREQSYLNLPVSIGSDPCVLSKQEDKKAKLKTANTTSYTQSQTPVNTAMCSSMESNDSTRISTCVVSKSSCDITQEHPGTNLNPESGDACVVVYERNVQIPQQKSENKLDHGSENKCEKDIAQQKNSMIIPVAQDVNYDICENTMKLDSNKHRTCKPLPKNIICSKAEIGDNSEADKSKLFKNKDDNRIDISNNSTSVNNLEMSSQGSSSVFSHLMEGSETLEYDDNLKRKPRSRKRRSSSSVGQRQSVRIAELSSQDNSSQSSNDVHITSSLYMSTSTPKVKNNVIVSSMFQCLVDEVKRKDNFDEFSIPTIYIETYSVGDKENNVGDDFQFGACIEESDKGSRTRNISNLTNQEKSTISKFASQAWSGETAYRKDTLTTTKEYSAVDIHNKPSSHHEHVSTPSKKQVKPHTLQLQNIPVATEEICNRKNDNAAKSSPRLQSESLVADDISPTLFESQTNFPQKFNYDDKLILDVKSADLKLDWSAVVQNDSNNNNCNVPHKLVVSNSQSVKCMLPNSQESSGSLHLDVVCTDKNENSCADPRKQACRNDSHIDEHGGCQDSEVVHLLQTGSFQVPKSEQLLSMVAMEIVTENAHHDYIVCLCTTSLRIYRTVDHQWTHVWTQKLSTNIKKNSGCRLYSLSHTREVSVVLQQVRSDSTNLTLYTYTGDSMKQTLVDDIWARSVCVCPLQDHNLIVSHYTDERTYMTKYSLDQVTASWTQTEMDSCQAHVTSVVRVRGINTAVVGLTNSGNVLIWNHMFGYLLSTIDISDVCPHEAICPAVYSDQGFLFLLMMMKTKSKEPGSVVVINPQIGSSETLSSLQTGVHTWTGCTQASVINQNLLLARETCGRVHLWDVFTGGHLATIEDVTVTCYSSTNHCIAMAHKHCVHVYEIKSDDNVKL